MSAPVSLSEAKRPTYSAGSFLSAKGKGESAKLLSPSATDNERTLLAQNTRCCSTLLPLESLATDARYRSLTRGGTQRIVLLSRTAFNNHTPALYYSAIVPNLLV